MIECIETAPETQREVKTTKPPMFHVVMFNDDYTPMEFVVDIIQKLFHKDLPQATQLMLQIHHLGQAICGTYPKDVAEMKVMQVTNIARREGHPLLCDIRKERQ